MRRRCELLPLADRPRSRRQDKREKYYDSRSIGCFMFRIDDEVVVDATLVGNAGRFINHSCDPNCASRIIQVEGAKHIVIFAERPIEAGEELTYDYKVRAVVRRCGTTLWHEVVARGCGTRLWHDAVAHLCGSCTTGLDALVSVEQKLCFHVLSPPHINFLFSPLLTHSSLSKKSRSSATVEQRAAAAT